MWLFLEAADVWLFRDGRPFDVGADHRAVSMFPPSPTTIQGAIRSKLLALYGIPFLAYAVGEAVQADVIEQIGTANKRAQGTMRIRGPFLGRRQPDEGIMPYFPAPADLLQVEGEGYQRLLPLYPADAATFVSNWPADAPDLRPCLYDEALLRLGTNDERQKYKAKRPNAWISATAMQAYLTGHISTAQYQKKDKQKQEKQLDEMGQIGPAHLHRSATLFGNEYQLGIGLEADSKRPSDGLLYTVTYKRPCKDVGLLVQVLGLEESKWPATGVLSLGGSRKGARYTRIEKPVYWPQSILGGNKLYMATPTLFEGGWQAADWATYMPHDNKLVAALVARPLMIGGWDMATNRPKGMRPYVPAGCVYFFEAAINEEKTIIDVPICDDEAAGQIGFGTTFIGRW